MNVDKNFLIKGINMLLITAFFTTLVLLVKASMVAVGTFMAIALFLFLVIAFAVTMVESFIQAL